MESIDASFETEAFDHGLAEECSVNHTASVWRIDELTMTASVSQPSPPFFGPWVVRSAFVLAVFGWGVGFYGPPVFLHAVVARTAWPLGLVSTAVTLHFLLGAVLVANLPRLHRRFGLPFVTALGATATALGVVGWAVAREPWQLFVAALLSGGGWVTMGAAAINAIVAPWYARGRPIALAKAYNGASIGGVIFSPLWVVLIERSGFAAASVIVGGVLVAVVATLASVVFAKTPERLGQRPDGDAPCTLAGSLSSVHARPLPGRQLWRSRQFLTLAAGMAAGLFAQIGLIAHLFSLLVPTMGAQVAGLTMGLATACAISGRYIAARMLPIGVDRRLVCCAAYTVQLIGSIVLLAADEPQIGLILSGVVLFGFGIGNATSLPPLVAQMEFAKDDVGRVVALIVATSQATYSFAPAVFGLVLTASDSAGAHIGHDTMTFFFAAAAIQALAVACFLIGRRRA
jgi:MFS family permease